LRGDYHDGIVTQVEKGIMADIYLEVRKRRGHIFFE
jgi:hypothetical protein